MVIKKHKICDMCGREVGINLRYYIYPNFCPNCGADMREGEAE